jgi:hypothetical protein
MSAANQLPVSNIINVSVAQQSPGLGAYNTSNLALFTDEAPNLSTFGSLGYAQYLSPTQVGIDFGTSSRTYIMANAVFSQQPNILLGGGQLVVILMTNAIQHVAFSGTPASGTFELVYNSNATAAINWNDSASTIQGKVQAVAGLSQVLVTGSMATSLNIQMAGIYAPLTLTTTANSLLTSGSAAITITITTPTAAQTLTSAINANANLVQFFGLMANENQSIIGQTDLLASAAAIQALNKILFVVSNQSADIAPGGMLDLLRSGSLTQTRGLYYGDSSENNDLIMMASYAGLALSVNFNGSQTTITMNLKVLSGVQPDPTMTQTIFNSATTAGADTYVSFQGVSGVSCSGANLFYDAVYNAQWLAGAIQVAAFNYLQQASTKIPQTENGMTGFKGAIRAVMQQSVVNGYCAPGSWTSPVTFGNQALFLQNVSQVGYYIFSSPVAQQLQTARAARQAPLVQIALKAAGAIQSANIIVNVNS